QARERLGVAPEDAGQLVHVDADPERAPRRFDAERLRSRAFERTDRLRDRSIYENPKSIELARSVGELLHGIVHPPDGLADCPSALVRARRLGVRLGLDVALRNDHV